MSSRADLRRALQARRSALNPGQQHWAALRTAAQLTQTPWFQQARRIAVYLAVRGELDPTPLVRLALHAGKQVYLPTLSTDNSLKFQRWTPCTALRRNRFGIREPYPHARRHLSPADLDLVATPLVAFDPKGNRLGMGGGFYDRTFAYSLKGRGRRRPILIGLAYDFQAVPSLTREPWDVPLSAVVTPHGVLRFRSG